MIKSFYSFVTFRILKCFFGIFRILEFDESEISFNFNFIFEGFIVLFGFSNGNFGNIDWTEWFKGFNKLFNSYLFFQVFGE